MDQLLAAAPEAQPTDTAALIAQLQHLLATLQQQEAGQELENNSRQD